MPRRPRRSARRGRRWRSRFSLTVLFLIALAFVVARLPWQSARVDTTPPAVSLPVEGAWRTVQRVVDGDTVVLEDGERVRLIGVDTPEVHESEKLRRDAERTGHDVAVITALGKRASAFTEILVPCLINTLAGQAASNS
jgi:micrococcal nuclease